MSSEGALAAADVKQAFADGDWQPGESEYLAMHAGRIAYMVNLVQEYQRAFGVRSILDIGPNFLTTSLKKFLKPELSVSTLGWANKRLVPAGVADLHIACDLNELPQQPLPITQRFDLIVFAETIEHLHTSPAPLLKCLRGLLRAQAGILIVQTPNAVSFSKRVKMVKGINPFELIRENRRDPGHFREYTMQELVAYGTQAGFKVLREAYCDYWQPRDWPGRQLGRLYPPFREGITISFVTE